MSYLINQNSKISLQKSNILVFLITLSIFSDINFIGFGNFVISFKFIATSLGTFLMLYSLKKINFNFYFLKYSFLFYLLFNIPQILSGDLMIDRFIYFLSYGIFLTVFLDFLKRKNLSKFFLESFVRIAAFVSFLACLQVFNIIPVIENKVDNIVLDAYNINQGDILDSKYKRGTGLMFDGNFFGMILALSFAINRFILNYRGYSILIILGLLASFSRSALLAVLFVYLFSVNYSSLNIRSVIKFLLILLTIFSTIFFLSTLFPNSLFSYFFDRIFEIYEVLFLFNFNENSIIESSTSMRIFSIIAAYYIFIQNPIIGVGIDGSRLAFQEFLGTNTVAHNTFIEFFVVAGIWGIIPTIIYIRQFFIIRGLGFQKLKLYKSILGALFISFMTLTHMQSLILFFPFFFKKLIKNTNI